MRQVWNFSAGPAQIPASVLKKAQEELHSYNDSGMSIMEMSHRSNVFEDLMKDTEDKLRHLLTLPDDYAVLFLQGGASLQFAMAPMNLKKKGTAAYIHTGSFSKKAIEEAKRVGMQIDVVASSKAANFTQIPKWSSEFSSYDYVHITTNNTIEGTTFYEFPNTGSVPLVADMSSNILSEPLDVTNFGLIYAGAQKNLGIAGLTVVIIRKDLLNINPGLPKMLNYQTYFEKTLMHNTPPTFSIYITNLILTWVEEQGGLEKIGKMNRIKAKALYDYLDESTLFQSVVQGKDRSIMNVPFVTGDKKLDQDFIRYAEKNRIQNIKGHRSVGGMRASIYNAMPLEGVQTLIETMKAFEKQIGGATNEYTSL